MEKKIYATVIAMPMENGSLTKSDHATGTVITRIRARGNAKQKRRNFRERIANYIICFAVPLGGLAITLRIIIRPCERTLGDNRRVLWA